MPARRGRTYFRTREVADILGTTRQTIGTRIAAGKIPAVPEHADGSGWLRVDADWVAAEYERIEHEPLADVLHEFDIDPDEIRFRPERIAEFADRDDEQPTDRTDDDAETAADSDIIDLGAIDEEE